MSTPVVLDPAGIPPPALFDPQVNGYGGIDFQSDHPSPEGLLAAARAWRRDGGDQFFLTLVTDDWGRLLARLRKLRSIVSDHPFLRGVIPGWHVEGPFLSDQPGFHGAHDPGFMLDPEPAHFHQLLEAVGGDPLLVTLAPERAGSLEAISTARRLGITVSLGHTNASAPRLREAVAAGATGFTHLGNACPQLLDRHDNILWRVADVPGLVVGLVADGQHLPPPLFRSMHRLFPTDRLYYTTDAMAAAGAPPGVYSLGRLRLEVGLDRVVRQPGKPNFAGSALTPSDLASRVDAMLAGTEATATRRSTRTALAWLGLHDRP